MEELPLELGLQQVNLQLLYELGWFGSHHGSDGVVTSVEVEAPGAGAGNQNFFGLSPIQEAHASDGDQALEVGKNSKQLFVPRWNEACAGKGPSTLPSCILVTGVSGTGEYCRKLTKEDVTLLSEISPKIVGILKVAGSFVVDPMSRSAVKCYNRMWAVLDKFDTFFLEAAQPGGLVEQLGWKREYHHMCDTGYFAHSLLVGFCDTHEGVELDDQAFRSICEVVARLVLSPKSEFLEPDFSFKDLCQEFVALASQELENSARESVFDEPTLTCTADLAGEQHVHEEAVEDLVFLEEWGKGPNIKAQQARAAQADAIRRRIDLRQRDSTRDYSDTFLSDRTQKAIKARCETELEQLRAELVRLEREQVERVGEDSTTDILGTGRYTHQIHFSDNVCVCGDTDLFGAADLELLRDLAQRVVPILGEARVWAASAEFPNPYLSFSFALNCHDEFFTSKGDGNEYLTPEAFNRGSVSYSELGGLLYLILEGFCYADGSVRGIALDGDSMRRICAR